MIVASGGSTSRISAEGHQTAWLTSRWVDQWTVVSGQWAVTRSRPVNERGLWSVVHRPPAAGGLRG